MPKRRKSKKSRNKYRSINRNNQTKNSPAKSYPKIESPYIPTKDDGTLLTEENIKIEETYRSEETWDGHNYQEEKNGFNLRETEDSDVVSAIGDLNIPEETDDENNFASRLKNNTEYFLIFSSVYFIISVVEISITIASFFAESTLARFDPQYGITPGSSELEYSARVLDLFMSEYGVATIPFLGILLFLGNGISLYYYTDTSESIKTDFDKADLLSEKLFSIWKNIFLGCITMSMLLIAIFATWKGW